MQNIDYQQALLEETRDLPDDLFPILLQIVRLYKESILAHSQRAVNDLRAEFDMWDRLSDEALFEFEKEL